MTRSQIIAIVNGRTEGKLVGQVDFNDLFNDVEQELCAEYRFWWLHKRLNFSTAAGTPTYDLTTIATVPANAGPFVDEITRVTLIDSAGNVTKLQYISDDEGVAAILADTTSDKPGFYTFENNDMTNSQLLRLAKIPNGVYTVYVYFWAMPNPSADTSDDAIYLIPQSKHHILKTALEKEVWRLSFGEQDPKYVTALQEYQRKVEQAKKKPAFSTEKELYFTNQQSEAIRSTR